MAGIFWKSARIGELSFHSGAGISPDPVLTTFRLRFCAAPAHSRRTAEPLGGSVLRDYGDDGPVLHMKRSPVQPRGRLFVLYNLGAYF